MMRKDEPRLWLVGMTRKDVVHGAHGRRIVMPSEPDVIMSCVNDGRRRNPRHWLCRPRLPRPKRLRPSCLGVRRACALCCSPTLRCAGASFTDSEKRYAGTVVPKDRVPVKRHPGSRDTHGTHTGRTRASRTGTGPILFLSFLLFAFC